MSVVRIDVSVDGEPTQSVEAVQLDRFTMQITLGDLTGETLTYRHRGSAENVLHLMQTAFAKDWWARERIARRKREWEQIRRKHGFPS